MSVWLMSKAWESNPTYYVGDEQYQTYNNKYEH